MVNCLLTPIFLIYPWSYFLIFSHIASTATTTAEGNSTYGGWEYVSVIYVCLDVAKNLILRT